MKKWQSYSKSFVSFTEKHWMMSQTFVLYMDLVMDCYIGKPIGLIVDYAPSHDNSELQNWIKHLNNTKKASKTTIIKTTIIVDWVDKGLIIIYQPGDIGINKPMKDIIRNSYHPYVTENTVSFKAGQKIQVSREQLLSFIEKAVDTINDQQKRTMTIYKCFKICGLGMKT